MRWLLPLVLLGCAGTAPGSLADAATDASLDAVLGDPCPAAAMAWTTGMMCNAVFGRAFARECATIRPLTRPPCVPAFDALVRCRSAAPRCDSDGGKHGPVCEPELAALTDCLR